jgi:molybdate transport system substrate-binding protein
MPENEARLSVHSRRLFSRMVAVALGVLLLLSVGCERAKPPPTPVPKAEQKVEEKELVVFAAASLREAFATMSDAVEKTKPNVKVTFNFAGSQELRTQIQHGASADVFACADQKHMSALVAAKKVQAPAVFAHNEPVVIVAKESAEKLRAFTDLPKAKRIVLGVPEVPIGRYTLEILDKASRTLGSDFRSRVEARVVSRELNVRQVLAKVTLGEADAAVVYRTDAQTAKDRVAVVTIPTELNVIAEYPIAVLDGAPHPELARGFVALVLSAEGQAVLSNAGFMLAVPAEKTP